MLRSRIVSVGVFAAIAVALLTNIAAAQTAMDGQVGKPLALLAGLRPPHDHEAQQSKATVRAKTAGATSKKTAAKKIAATTKSARAERHRLAAKPAVEPTTVAAVQADATPAPPAASSFATSVWPVNAAAATDAAAAPSPGTAADDGLKMSAVVVDGQTVQVASPEEVNAIDLAADDNMAVKAATPAGRTDAKPAARAVFAAPVHQDETGSSVGSASWIAQVLAALGGAVAAGTVAWFLIGGGPQRMYGVSE